MSKKVYSIEELADILGQAGILKSRVTEIISKIGHIEHTISENEREISRIESLKETNKRLAVERESLNKQKADEESQMNEKFKILSDNGVPVSDSLKGTTIVSVG